jgi:hypothetical protein
MARSKGTPYTMRWLWSVQDNPHLSWRAKAAAVPIFRHANIGDGRDCKVGVKRASAEMSVNRKTILAGWTELAEAGYLEVFELPPARWREQGALRFPTFPGSNGDLVRATDQAGPSGGPDLVRHTDTTVSHSDSSTDPETDPSGSAVSTTASPKAGEPTQRKTDDVPPRGRSPKRAAQYRKTRGDELQNQNRAREALDAYQSAYRHAGHGEPPDYDLDDVIAWNDHLVRKYEIPANEATYQVVKYARRRGEAGKRLMPRRRGLVT